MFDKFFDCLNVRCISESVHRRKPDLRPYRSPDDARLKVSVIRHYIYNFELVVVACQVMLNCTDEAQPVCTFGTTPFNLFSGLKEILGILREVEIECEQTSRVYPCSEAIVTRNIGRTESNR